MVQKHLFNLYLARTAGMLSGARQVVMLLVTMLLTMTAQTAWAQTVQFPIYSGDEGTEAKPYQIKSTADLIKLAADVNSGTSYEDKYFILTQSITFSNSTSWNTGTESNFDGIGTSSCKFKGHFNGQGYTISGLRIYKNQDNVGLYGFVQLGSVKNVTLDDARISGKDNTGGIVGSLWDATVDNCHVTATVAIADGDSYSQYHGGIVGECGWGGCIVNCTSSATLNALSKSLGAYGGIVGSALGSSRVENCLAINAVIPDVGHRGAIAGYNVGSLSNNYYLNCNVAGTVNATGVGCDAADVPGNDGAVSIHTITFNDGTSTSTDATKVINATNYYKKGLSVTLAGKQSDSYSYTVNGEGIAGNTFTMPASNVVIGTAVPYTVTVSNVTGGSVVATPGGGKAGDVISLAVTPNAGYILNGISAEDASHNAVVVNGGEWYGNNMASFSMPGANVMVTPSFTDDLTVGSLSVNLPQSGIKSITIPAGVQSFKVYDDGGATGSFSAYCNETLTLTAPDGCKLQLTGTMNGGLDSRLSVFDGTSTSATPLLQDKACDRDGMFLIETNIGIINSTDKYMTIQFSNNSSIVAGTGVNLNVTVVMANTKRAITITNAANGSVESNVTTAKMDETITLTATPATGHALGALSVQDIYSNEVPVTWNVFENMATFTMPGTAVTVTPIFVSTSPLCINIPRKNTITATIPAGVTTVKVYDDGGEGGGSDNSAGNYSNNCSGSLTLNAPTGYVLQLLGYIRTEMSFDALTVFDNNAASGTKLLDGVRSTIVSGNKTDIPTVFSTGQSMTLYFESDGQTNYAGLDLTVTPVPALSENIGITDAASLQGKDARFSRTFTADVASTVCLPFTMTSITGGTAYEFTAMNKSGDDWIATMAAVTSTVAGKPYLFKASADGAVSFSGTVSNGFDGTAGTSSANYNGDGSWTFRGTYTKLTYGTDLDGAVYGFAAQSYSTNSINPGDFVKAETGAYIPPFRCYLTYNAPSSARSLTRGADIELPSRIIVRLVGSNGQTTAIGTMDTKTGEVVFGDEWFTLDGRRIEGQPTQKGVYIQNGKKIIVK